MYSSPTIGQKEYVPRQVKSITQTLEKEIAVKPSTALEFIGIKKAADLNIKSDVAFENKVCSVKLTW